MKTSDVVAAIAAAAKEVGIDECNPDVSVVANETRTQWTATLSLVPGGKPYTCVARTRREALRGSVVHVWNAARDSAKQLRAAARDARATAAQCSRDARDADRFARELTAALEVKP